ncbi:hypothetical protein WJX72_012118 [[Myrmecia] bisecta]|uniref:Uncharacterized protein n=1 Tax=[Myrmecia] bisecta TaxID=41462 RepID=A0AAW1Q510_9CHLO
MASMPESPPYALDSLFTIQRVEVVQSLEIDKLKATLQWLVDTVAQAPGPADVATLTQQVQALQAKDKVAEQQAERLRSLAEQQSKLDEGLEEATANAHKAQASLEELQALPKQVDQLKAEVAGLQSKLAGSRQAQEQLQKQVQDATSAGSNRRQSRDQPAAGNVSSEAPAALTAAVGADNVSEQLLNGLQQEMDDLKARQNELAAVQRDLARSNGQLQDEQARLRQGWTDRQVETDTALGAQAGRSAELGAEVATLRAAIEAVGQGKGFELPPSPPVAAPVDLGPLERRIGAKADAEEMTVAGLAAAGDAKADQDALERLEAEVQQLQARSSPDQRAFDSVREELAHLQLLLTGKAEAEALQNLALEVAMLQAAPSATLTMNATTSATPAAAETAPGASLRPSAVGDNSLLAAVQKLVAGKADKDELHLLRRLLGEKANALDLQTIQEALEKLQQDMQRNSASLAGLQRRVTGEAVQTSGWRATPEPPATPSHTTSGLRASGRMSSSLDRDVSPMMASNVDNAPAGTIGTAEIIELQQEVASLKRALDVIARATQVMAVGQPGPAGNPSGGGSPHEPLQKQGGAGRSGQQASGRPQGPGPLEDITASLANALNNGDIRLKADASKLNHSENRQQPASEDVAAASGRTAGAPRPKLDLDKSVRALRSEVAALKKKLAGAGDVLQRKSQALIAEASRPALSGEARGPQNWYKDKHGPAAEVLPRGDVGPHLAGGGWRATAPQQRAQTASGSSRRKGLGREADGLSGWEKSNHKLPGL